jgi:hypothetical protein
VENRINNLQKIMQYKKIKYSNRIKRTIDFKRLFFLFPRILAIIYILFIIFFSLNSTQTGIISKIMPALLLIILLILVWKKNISGGSIFILIGIVFTISLNTMRTLLTFLLISFPPLLIGILFLFRENFKKGIKLKTYFI